MIHPQTLEAFERMVPTGNRSEFIDHLIARQLGVERDILGIVDQTQKTTPKKTHKRA